MFVSAFRVLWLENFCLPDAVLRWKKWPATFSWLHIHCLEAIVKWVGKTRASAITPKETKNVKKLHPA
jgi:hypothetical protein